MTRSFHHIGFDEIKKILSEKDEIFKMKSLNIVLEGEGELYGEIDLIFLSYALLFLKSEKELKISIYFKNKVDSSKFFKFTQQVNQAKVLYPNIISGNNFSIRGSYILRETGEVRDVATYNELVQSNSFIPPLLIYKKRGQEESIDPKDSSINSFFKKPIDRTKPIAQLYFEKNEEILKSKLSIDKKEQNLYIENFIERSSNFSFLKTCLLRVLFDTSLFERKGNNKNIDIFKNLEVFADNLIIGLEELANNIIQHSGSAGVITIRKFDSQILVKLKGQKNVTDYFLLHADINDFLDINIIDLGTVNIKKHYAANLKNTKNVLIESFSNNLQDIKKESSVTFETEHQQKIIDTIGIEFENDISIIEQKDFAFKNFFIKDKEIGIDKLSVQQNKFITKIGLQYFTSIIKDTYKGFIQVSSGEEKTILYNDAKGKTITDSSDDSLYILLGTFYSCYVPLTLIPQQKVDLESKNEDNIKQDPNSFSELTKYNFIGKNQDIKTDYKINLKNIIDFNSQSLFDKKKSGYWGKYDIFIEFYTELLKFKAKTKIDFSKSNDIIAVSCKKLQIDRLTNGSDWVRLIWTLSNYFENIILYDIDIVHFISIIHLRNQFAQNCNLKFWDDDSRVLFYSKKEQKKDTEYYRYGANILAGGTIDEFCFLNKRIWNHHYSFKIEKLGIQPAKNIVTDSSHLKTIFFSEKGNLHYYEILLSTTTENENHISLFEKSVQYSLNTLLEEKHNDSTNNRGYKITNTHFKLGSKIHISDFYYAKKLFQNSFFTTPLAYSIAKNIIESYFNLEETENKVSNSITLVGYEDYSSFLVSSVRNFLTKFNTDKKEIDINHLIIKDGNISIDRSKLYQRVFLIVPIASTFNTALKIEDQLNEIKNKKRQEELEKNGGDVFIPITILQPSQNVVWVGHRDEGKLIFENYFKEDGGIIDNNNIYQKHDWKKVDKIDKVITIERYHVPNNIDAEKIKSEKATTKYSQTLNDENKKERRQKYLIPVYTKWQEANDCKLCYPSNIHQEKCLIETGNASITPQVIFGFPKTKKYHSLIGRSNSPQLSLEGSLLFGHLAKANNRYLFYTRTGKVVEENETVIVNWIKEIQHKTKDLFSNKKVVIVTPNTGPKSKFLDLINEHLFEYAANCIIISLKEDYIENAETLYSDGIYSADTVVYVDDVLSTINSFLEVNYIVKYIRDKNKNGKGIDYCISLINRMTYENEDNLLLKLSDLNNFVIEKESEEYRNRLIYLQKDYHPNIEEANNEFPLKIEQNKYLNLERNSSLDQIRNHFHNKRINLQKQNLIKPLTEDIKDYSFDFSRQRKRRNKKLYQYLVLNALYQFFEFTPIGNLKEYKDERDRKLREYFPALEEDFLKNEIKGKAAFEKLVSRIKDILERDYNHQHIIGDYNKNIDFVIIRIICCTPLIYYKPIRENALNWILIKLKTLTENIDGLSEIKDFYKINETSDYNHYQDLKFLLKKSVKLKSNFIIHKDTLEFYKKLIDRIKNEMDGKSLKKQNKLFSRGLQKLTTNPNYVSNPYIRLTLYDFVQNKLKDGIFSSIVFDKFVVTKNGLFRCTSGEYIPINKDEERNIHKEIIKDYLNYRDSIALMNSNEKLESTGQLSTDPSITDIFQRRDIVTKSHSNTHKVFKKEFSELLYNTPHFKISTTKNLIVNIVALVQELTNEQEVKSIKLDTVMDCINPDPNCNENGTYKHLLRLLRLENIEVINNHTNELIDKLNYNLSISKFDFNGENLKIGYIENTKVQEALMHDKKYKDLYNNNKNSNSSISSFISLRKYLRDTINSENEDKIQLKIKLITSKIQKIINGGSDSEVVEDVFLTINYKDFDKFEKSDTYTFSLNENSLARKELIDDDNSLTTLMGKEKFITSDEHLFSHFEIMKSHDGTLICRNNDKIVELINNSTQFLNLENSKSILLIRISDFRKDDQIKENNIKFNTRGVLTIYLNQATRIKEKSLRLLLALRADLLEFIIKKTMGSTFLELLKSKEQDDLIENSTHFLSKFHRSISANLNFLVKYEEYKKTIEYSEHLKSREALQTEILTDLNCVFAQINSIDAVQAQNTIEINYIELKKFLVLLFNSHTESNFNIESYKIILNSMPNTTIHYPVWYIIIPQIIYNIKKYTRNINGQIEIYYSEGYLYFENIVNVDATLNVDKTRKSQGIDLCKKLIKLIYGCVDNEVDKYLNFKLEKNKYNVKLKIS